MSVATSTSLHVLIAHGDSGLRTSYSDSLSQRGFLITTAPDGLACLALLRGISPDVLVIEQSLRWGGGDGVLARLREDATLPRIPIVILLADPDRVDPRLTSMPNMQCYENLLPPHQLARKIRQLIDAVSPIEDHMLAAS